jgi:hypothetical protein
MRLAHPREKESVIEMIVDAIADNPKIQYLLGAKNFDNKLRALAQFIYSISNRRKAIHVSDDGHGVMIFMENTIWKKNWLDAMDHLKMIWSAFEWTRLIRIFALERELESNRPKEKRFLYVWVLGTRKAKKGGDQARELRDALFSKATELGLPIYAETAFDQNFQVYQRFGFVAYHTQHYPSIPLSIYFLKRENN